MLKNASGQETGIVKGDAWEIGRSQVMKGCSVSKEEVWPLSSSYAKPLRVFKYRSDVVRFTFQAFPLEN